MRKKRTKNNRYQSIIDVCYIWAKEMRMMFADEGVFLFCIVVPILYPLLYSWIYTNEVARDFPVAVVDNSLSPESREFIRKFDASPDAKVAYHCNNIEEAKDLIGRQEVHGILYFPSDFATKINRGEQAHVSVFCDMSLLLAYRSIASSAVFVSMDMGKKIQLRRLNAFTEREEEVNLQPMEVSEVPIFNAPIGYGNFLIPIVLMMVIQQTILLGLGLSVGTARENNRFDDLVPMNYHFSGPLRIVFGKSLAMLMVYAVQTTWITLCVTRFFGYTSLGAGKDILMLMFPYILACIFFGMTLSCLVRYRENVLLLAVFTSIPFLFLTGIAWPQTSVPAFWQYAATLIPSTFGARGFVRINVMGATLSDVAVEYRALWLQVLFYFITSWLVYRYQFKSAHKHALHLINVYTGKIRKVLEERHQKTANNNNAPLETE